LVAGGQPNQFIDPDGNIVMTALNATGEDCYVPAPFQPGEYLPGNFDPSHDADWYADTDNYTPGVSPMGYIQNTGSLAIILQMGDGTGLNVTRYYSANPAQFPCTQSLSQMTYTAAGVAGVDGAVLSDLFVPPTPANLASNFQPDGWYLLQDSTSGLNFLYLAPGAKVDVAGVIDLKTHAGYDTLSSANPLQYLDNTYMNCSIQLNSQGWVATQADEDGALTDVFGTNYWNAVPDMDWFMGNTDTISLNF
jgi:hypothetical protein